jgi:alpha-beta hydrolase superfamily lysophospholipase
MNEFVIRTDTAEAFVRVPASENASLPIVVLVHGTSGDLRAMASPAQHPGFNHNRRASIPSIRDHGWRSYPGISVWGYAVDPFGQVTSWQKALNDAAFRTVNYSQIDPKGSLVQPIAQLSTLMRALMDDPRHRGRRFSLLGHSRGGILARALVVDAAMRRTFDLTRIRQVITLHSPNQGSSLANLAISVNQLVGQLRALPGADLIAGLLDFIQEQAGALAYHDYKVGSDFLRNLAAREPLPDIQYATFGGNSTSVTRHRLWWFTWDSAVPQWNIPPFHWRTVPQELGVLIPPDLHLPLEMVHGRGDLLVTDAAARLPGAPHRTNPLNHAEALWNPGLQQQVLSLLRASVTLT